MTDDDSESASQNAEAPNKNPFADAIARFAEVNKENTYARVLGDLYVNMLRCSRSPNELYDVDAATSLIELFKVLELEPTTNPLDVVKAASQRVGWPEKPNNEFHRSLDQVAKAAITYMIAASTGGFLSKRTDEFVRAIDHFQQMRGRQP